MSLQYTARTPVIVNYTIVVANTWERAAVAVAGVRKWMIKVSEATSGPFDLAFKAAPTTYFSNSGVGFSLDNCDLGDVYVRSTVPGTVIEILYFG